MKKPSFFRPLSVLVFSALLVGGLSTFAQEAQPSQYSRQMYQENGQWIYIVNHRAPHLYMISRDLYGTEGYWAQIAKWNNLSAPYALEKGQKLAIRKAPTSSVEQGDQDLIKSWKAMQKWSVAEGIEKLSSASQPEVEAEETAAPPATPAATGIVAETQKLTDTPEKPEVAPEAAPVKLESRTEAPAHHSKWHFGVAAAASIFDLKSDNHVHGVNNKFESEVDYGVDLEAAYQVNEKTHLIFGAMVEHMDISHDDTTEIEGHSQYIWKFTAGLEREVTERVSLAGSLIYEQLPFAEPTPSGADISAIYIPQVSLGARWNFLTVGNFKSFLVADGLYLFSKNEGEHEIKAGEGYIAGFKFQNKLSHSTLSYGVTYRYIKQNTEAADNHQNAYFANLGLLF